MVHQMIPAHKRRWFRFSLRTLFLVVAVVCVWIGLAWPLQAVRQRQAMRVWIEHHRGQVFYTLAPRERWNNRGRVEPAGGYFVTSPLRSFMGDQKATTIAIPDDGTFSPDEVARIRNVFPECELWFDK
jgi:hypothetical protein